MARAQAEIEREGAKVQAKEAVENVESEWFVVKLLERASSSVLQSAGINLPSAAQVSLSQSESGDKEAEEQVKSSEARRGVHLTHNYEIPHDEVNTTLLIHFFGKNGDDLLDYNDFCT